MRASLLLGAYNVVVDHRSKSRSLTLTPAADLWRGALERRTERDPRSLRFRAQMALPIDRAIIMSGHQAEFWHPGILAKYIAMREAARRFGAVPVWLIVDQDTNDPFTIAYPARASASGASVLQRREWRAVGTAGHAGHVPTARLSAAVPSATPPGDGLDAAPGVALGLSAMRDAIARRATESSAARQVGLAALDIAARLTELEFGPASDVRVVFASDVARTDLFAEVVNHLGTSANPAREQYNLAVHRHPAAGVAGLAPGELPLWRIPGAMGARRTPVYDADLSSTPISELAPRALLLTGLTRWCGCEMFIHGMGGAGPTGEGGYDRVAAEWLSAWLGASLAPMAMVTATLHLDIDSAAPALGEIDRTRWLAHAARHHPGLIGDDAAQRQRDAALARLQALKRDRDPGARPARIEAYRELHRALADWRRTRADRLGSLAERGRIAMQQRLESQIVNDRTWAFPLYEPAQIHDLARQIRDAFDE